MAFLSNARGGPLWDKLKSIYRQLGTIRRAFHIQACEYVYFLIEAWPAFLMERCICIHAHFYQPPRENPWLEAVERQDSAYPYHDWNERITAECYAPNGASRILDEAGYIRQIVNNYSRISLNFGPTLLSWLEDNCSRDIRIHSGIGPEEPGKIFRAWLSAGAGLQPHDSAAGQRARQDHPDSLGHPRF